MKRITLLACLITISCSITFSQSVKNPGESRALIDTSISMIERFKNLEFPSDSIASATPFGSFMEVDLVRRYRFYSDQQASLKKINATQLSLNDRIDLELLQYIVQEQINYYEYREYMNPILSDNGFHTEIAYEAGRQYSSVTELSQYLNRLKAFPAFAEQHIALIRKGLALGISQPVVALKGYETTYNNHIIDTIENSLFFQPFTNKPASIPQQKWDSLLTDARSVIAKDIIPAYRSIKTFFENEYYPKARKTLGASELPDGKAYYAALVKHHTTTDLTPDMVYDIGQAEVARIRMEMEIIISELNFNGSFQEFFAFLRTDPRFYATTPEQLLKEASYIAKKIDGKLPSLFGKLPRQPYGVAPVPEHLAPSYTTGRYSGASISSKNAGFYWVNTYNLPSRTLYTLEALTLHEAVPGHHLQIALTQELENLPRFRRNLYLNAFGEGWGLYSEYLGTELGLYQDPYSRFGRLTYEMWRACRLVIDAGIHSKGWTREQAVEFLASNSALSLHEVNTEINRYITWPGQALSYKIGELKILELRRKAELELGDKFDIRAFHDLVLSQGTVTLSLLDLMVNDWIAKSKVAVVK